MRLSGKDSSIGSWEAYAHNALSARRRRVVARGVLESVNIIVEFHFSQSAGSVGPATTTAVRRYIYISAGGVKMTGTINLL